MERAFTGAVNAISWLDFSKMINPVIIETASVLITAVQATIRLCHRRGIMDCLRHVSLWIGVCRIQWVRTGVQYHHAIHFYPQIDASALAAQRGIQSKASVITYETAIKPVDVAGKVSLGESVLGKLYQKCIIAILVPVVTILLIASFTKALVHMLVIAVAANTFVPTETVASY